MEDQFTSERLLIRPRTINDLEACMAMDCDPIVTKYIDGPWHNPGLHRTFLEERMATIYPYPLGYWSISLIQTPHIFLGWIMMLPAGQTTSKVEIGWRLTRETWGKGVATEATKTSIELLRKQMPLTEVIASIHPENKGSINVAEKIGMSFHHEELIGGVLERFYVLPISPVPQSGP